MEDKEQIEEKERTAREAFQDSQRKVVLDAQKDPNSATVGGRKVADIRRQVEERGAKDLQELTDSTMKAMREEGLQNEPREGELVPFVTEQGVTLLHPRHSESLKKGQRQSTPGEKEIQKAVEKEIK